MTRRPFPGRLTRGGRAGLVAIGLVVFGTVTASLTVLAPAASAAGRNAAGVPAGFRQGRVLILRPHRIEMAADGVVRRVVPHTGPLDLARLPELLADGRYSRRMSPTSVRLSAPLLQRPGTSVVASARGTGEIQLDAGIGLYGTRATLALTGVRLTSVSSRAPGLLSYGTGTAVTLRDTAIVGLGRGGRRPVPAVRVAHAVVEATDLTLSGGGPGIVVDRATSASLTRVRVQGCGGDGIVIKGGRRVRLGGLAVQGCRGDGVRVNGPVSPQAFSGPVSVAGSAGSGLLLSDVRDVRLVGVTSRENARAGVQLSGVKNVSLERVSATGDQVAVAMTDSENVRVSEIRAQSVGVGVSAKRTTKLEIDAVEVVSARTRGLSLSATGVVITYSSVSAEQEGLVVRRGSQDVVVRNTVLAGTRDALKIAGSTSGVSLAKGTLVSPTGMAVRASGGDLSMVDCSVVGRIGVVVRGSGGRLRLTRTAVTAQGVALDLGRRSGAASVTGGRFTGAGSTVVAVRGDSLTMTDVSVDGGATAASVHTRLVAGNVSLNAGSVGVRAARSARVTITDGEITAGAVGASAARSAAVTLDQTHVSAPRPSSGPVTFLGRNRWSHLPLRWMALAVLLVMGIAMVLETVRKLRERSRTEQFDVPPHVLNWR